MPKGDKYIALTNHLRNCVLEKPLSNTMFGSGQWGERSLRSLWLYYEHHQEAFEKLRHKIPLEGFLYPPMKLMDMCLWQIGYDESPKKNESHV